MTKNMYVFKRQHTLLGILVSGVYILIHRNPANEEGISLHGSNKSFVLIYEKCKELPLCFVNWGKNPVNNCIILDFNKDEGHKTLLKTHAESISAL